MRRIEESNDIDSLKDKAYKAGRDLGKEIVRYLKSKYGNDYDFLEYGEISLDITKAFEEGIS